MCWAQWSIREKEMISSVMEVLTVTVHGGIQKAGGQYYSECYYGNLLCEHNPLAGRFT